MGIVPVACLTANDGGVPLAYEDIYPETNKFSRELRKAFEVPVRSSRYISMVRGPAPLR
jgi:hypothetical protein